MAVLRYRVNMRGTEEQTDRQPENTMPTATTVASAEAILHFTITCVNVGKVAQII